MFCLFAALAAAGCSGLQEPTHLDGGDPLQRYRYADFSSSFVPGEDAPDPLADISLVLHAPDDAGIVLGNGGSLIVGFGLDRQPPGFILDNVAQDDLQVYVVGNDPFQAAIEVGSNGIDFVYVGNVGEQHTSVDIARAGLATASFVRVVVLEGGTSFQIDAFQSL